MTYTHFWTNTINLYPYFWNRTLFISILLDFKYKYVHLFGLKYSKKRDANTFYRSASVIFYLPSASMGKLLFHSFYIFFFRVQQEALHRIMQSFLSSLIPYLNDSTEFCVHMPVISFYLLVVNQPHSPQWISSNVLLLIPGFQIDPYAVLSDL